MASLVRKFVSRRAGNRCEYCRLHEADLPRNPFHLEHIVAKKHGGLTTPSNLAWSCHLCNLFKQSDLSGRDMKTGKIVRLFNPRRQRWQRHFAWNGPLIVGKTPSGRATISVLRLNTPHRAEMRALLMRAGLLPP